MAIYLFYPTRLAALHKIKRVHDSSIILDKTTQILLNECVNVMHMHILVIYMHIIIITQRKSDIFLFMQVLVNNTCLMACEL